ncbi:ABC transporter ATP-binding protein [Natronoarchaeum sp. GCM10025703]|uniref:ABC transporter ATP-binding protein n=1 Tax=unclassified Natronoarchaeum TaxID=2620183 RepID=UPI00361B2CD3
MILDVDSVSKRYGDDIAIDDVSLTVDSGELVGLLGPSGCGKTTLVQAIAGHVRPTAGTVSLRGEAVTEEPPEQRQVGLVFQQSTLFPHMTVAENVAYGLEATGMDPERRAERVSKHLDLVGLDGRREAYPAELSGGQQRRVELARALAPGPDILLLDEPLSALDRTLRTRLRDEIGRIQRATGVTTLFVTHDQEEAMALADRLVVMDDGQIAGAGPPRELYESPPNSFVADFLGRSNVLRAPVDGSDPLTLSVGGRDLQFEPAGDSTTGDAVTVRARPRGLNLAVPDDPDATLSVPVTVTRISDRGTRYDLICRTGGDEEFVVEHEAEPPGIGESRTLSIALDDLVVFDDGTGERIDGTLSMPAPATPTAQSDGVGDDEEGTRSSDFK